ALDDLEEDRADHIFGKDLEEQAAAGFGRAVDQDAALAQFGDVMAVAGQAGVDHLIIGFGRLLEADAVGSKLVDGDEDVIGGERQMLDALAAIILDELLDLRMIVLAFVERDADLAVGRGHRLGEEAGRLPLDVEIADLAEVEDALIIIGPMVHAAALE